LRFGCVYLFQFTFVQYCKTLLNENEKIQRRAEDFARPDITVLREQKKKHEIQCDKPGIIQTNIDTVPCVGVHGKYSFSDKSVDTLLLSSMATLLLTSKKLLSSNEISMVKCLPIDTVTLYESDRNMLQLIVKIP